MKNRFIRVPSSLSLLFILDPKTHASAIFPFDSSFSIWVSPNHQFVALRKKSRLFKCFRKEALSYSCCVGWIMWSTLRRNFHQRLPGGRFRSMDWRQTSWWTQWGPSTRNWRKRKFTNVSLITVQRNWYHPRKFLFLTIPRYKFRFFLTVLRSRYGHFHQDGPVSHVRLQFGVSPHWVIHNAGSEYWGDSISISLSKMKTS